MKTKVILVLSFLISVVSFSQVGINTTVPSSMLNVIGSQEGTYTDVSASTILDNTHFYISFTGATAAQILTLPVSVVAPNDFGGRFYHIKNNGTVDITIKGSGAEKMRFGGATISTNTYVLKAGYFILISKNNNTTGDTWDIAFSGSLPSDPTTGNDIKKIVYDGIAPSANSSDGTKTIKIGELEFRFNGAPFTAAGNPAIQGGAATPQVRFINAIAANKSLFIGVNQQYEPDGFEYANVKLNFTPANSTTYQYITPVEIGVASPLEMSEINIFNIIDTVNDKYYRVTFYISGQSGASSYAIIAEYF